MKWELKHIQPFIWEGNEYIFKEKHKTHYAMEPVFINKLHNYWRVVDILEILNANSRTGYRQELYDAIIVSKIKQFNDEIQEIINSSPEGSVDETN